jgi:Asp-tRNA(Asn)/Glu-tRNA(Gln) amidotransferase A subunit family amidase
MNRLKQVQAVPYVGTLKRTRECRRDIRRTFEQVDVLALPTMREPAPLISETVNATHHRPPSNTSAAKTALFQRMTEWFTEERSAATGNAICAA